ncbi:hypothetical protein HORIV_30040 [Vreelandella olivaria]|uniref:Uncharacterized protein n=1 Tax=Vreelandella olivaria TaxID=390919 RepID=A0ABM7GIN5_9GAMM|nr:hypothetical protein HORIV_30040 [Halomonas olivaria]
MEPVVTTSSIISKCAGAVIQNKGPHQIGNPLTAIQGPLEWGILYAFSTHHWNAQWAAELFG